MWSEISETILTDVRECRVYWIVAIVLLVVAMTGCSYEPLDENGHMHRPWNSNPYAEKEHWLDSVWMDEDELHRRNQWEAENPPTDWVDSLRR